MASPPRRRLRRWIVSLFLIAAGVGCWWWLTSRVEPPRVRIAVSVDWEGRDLDEANLQAIRELRAERPDLPLTHFLNAAYFTRPGADAREVAGSIRSVLAPGDSLGLHIHSWRSLVEAAGIPYRQSPTFWGRVVDPPDAVDVGHDVELPAYTTVEIRALVRTSRALLRSHGFQLGRTFRAGGWLASPAVLEAIRAEGLDVDSSSTDVAWHDEIEGYPLRERIRELWPRVTATTAPYWIPTPAGDVLEMPDTGALADYVTAEEMTAHLHQAISRLQDGDGRDVFVHLGFHQETAARFLPRLRAALDAVCSGPVVPVVFETLEDSARRACERLGARR